MKTLIQYKTIDGETGEALVPGSISGITDAKHQLAHAKSLPTPEASAESTDDIDSRLRQGGVDPDSLKLTNLSE